MSGRYGTTDTAQLPIGLNGRTIDRMARPQPWKDQANCQGVDPDLIFPEWPPTRASRNQAAEAKAVCAGCPVRLHCLAYAIAHNEEYGIWGGCTERERRLVRRTMVIIRSVRLRPTA